MSKANGEHMVGRLMRYSDSKSKKRVEALVVDVRPGGEMVDVRTGKRLGRGIQFKLRPTNGGRAFWTVSMLAGNDQAGDVDAK